MSGTRWVKECCIVMNPVWLPAFCFLTSTGASEEIHGGPSPTGRLPGLLSELQEDVSHPSCTGWKDPRAQPVWEETGQASRRGGGRAEETGSKVKGAPAQWHYLPWAGSRLSGALRPHAGHLGAPVYVPSSSHQLISYGLVPGAAAGFRAWCSSSVPWATRGPSSDRTVTRLADQTGAVTAAL